MRSWIRIAEVGFFVVVAVALLAAWRADRRDRTQLAAQKRSVVTPAQILRDLPSEIPLPVPLALQPEPDSPPSDSQHGATGKVAVPSAPSHAVIPSEDLKPLYDFAIDCKACQAKLSAAQSDLADEKIKTTTLTKERDDAVHAAKGGGAWRRIARAAKWFAIGAAAGAIAAKSAH